MKKIIAGLCLLSQAQFVFAHESSISKWIDVTVQKGYILSLDLHKDKQCSKIWTKQIKEFMKHNPHIKNANKLYVNQKIKVQDCKVEIVEQSVAKIETMQKEEQIAPLTKKQYDYFVSAFMGTSKLEEKDDTGKNGFSFGARIGKNTSMFDKKLALSVGILSNRSKTSDENNVKGVYQVSTLMATADATLFFDLTSNLSLGPKLMIGLSDDLSFSELDKSETIAPYAGIEGLYNIKTQYNLEFSIMQRIDHLSRKNILGNFGLRYEF